MATYMLDRTEVTVDAYARCVAANACDPASTGPGYNWKQPGRERHPINGVSASMAASYCEWVGARLPSEREWAWALPAIDDAHARHQSVGLVGGRAREFLATLHAERSTI